MSQRAFLDPPQHPGRFMGGVRVGGVFRDHCQSEGKYVRLATDRSHDMPVIKGARIAQKDRVSSHNGYIAQMRARGMWTLPTSVHFASGPVPLCRSRVSLLSTNETGRAVAMCGGPAVLSGG